MSCTPGHDVAGLRGHRKARTLNGMKLWVDDIRPCPDGYTHARSVNEAIRLLERQDCT